jgi:transcriptional regulator with AAA-type ATPase domain
LLIHAPWPGNLRQLDNIIRRAYAMALACRGAPDANFIIEAQHIERALAHEAPPGAANTLAPMWQAAHAFVRECIRREQRGDAFSLDLSDSFRGLVLAAAIIQLGGSEEALAMFGLEQLFKNRNQKRTLRREMARVRKLMSILQEPLDPKLSAILYEIEDSSESSGR